MRGGAWLAAGLLLTGLAAPLALGEDVAWQPGRNDYTIAVSDGATIDATMWVPAGTAAADQLPAIIIIHGYGGSKDVGRAREAAQHGYVGFAYSTRGFGESTGQMDVVGPRSIQDLKELVAWLKDHGPVDAARVGVTGASYGGGHALLLATEPDPGVATVVPIVGWTDLQRALQPNHVTKLSYAAGFYATGNGLVQSGDKPVPLEVAGTTLSRRQLYDTYDLAVHVGFASLVAGVGQGDLEAYFRERSAALRVQNLRIPVFLVQGLSDDLFPADQALPFFQLIPAPEKRLHLGFVGHPRGVTGGAEVAYLYGEVYRWFDHYLKGQGPRPFDPAAPIEVARSPWDGTVLRLAAWPGGETGPAYALNPDSTLGAPAPAGLGALANTLLAGVPDDAAAASVAGDVTSQVPAGTPVDTLVFLGPSLEDSAELLGTPRAELRVRGVGASFQVAVKVFDRAPDGTSALVTRGIYGVPDHVPGVPLRLLFDLQPYRHTFAAGHRVEVRVAASDAPAYEPEKGPFALLLDLGEGGSLVRLPMA